MKRILLAASAVLALSAATDARSKGGLPDQMLGGWCTSRRNLSDAGTVMTGTFERSKQKDCLEGYEFIEIKPTRFSECVFDSVKRIPKPKNGMGAGQSDTWAVEARCCEVADATHPNWPTIDCCFGSTRKP